MSPTIEEIMNLRDSDGVVEDIRSAINPLKEKFDAAHHEIYEKLLTFLVSKNIEDNIKFTNFILFIAKYADDVVNAVRAMEERIEDGPYLHTIENITNPTIKADTIQHCYRIEDIIKNGSKYSPNPTVLWYDMWGDLLDASLADYWNTKISRVLYVPKFK